MTSVIIEKATLTPTRSGVDMRQQLNAIGLFPNNVIFHASALTPHFEAMWIQVRDTQAVPITRIETAQSYANQLRMKAANVSVLVCNTQRADWRKGNPVIDSSIHFVLTNTEESDHE